MPTIGGKSFVDRSDGSGTPIYQRTGGGGTGGSNLLVGRFLSGALNDASANGFDFFTSGAVGMEVDPSKTYKLLSLMNYGSGGGPWPGISSNYATVWNFTHVNIGTTIPTVEDGFILYDNTYHKYAIPSASVGLLNINGGDARVWMFIRNNFTGNVYREDANMTQTYPGDGQRVAHSVSNASIMYIGLNISTYGKTDVKAVFEVS